MEKLDRYWVQQGHSCSIFENGRLLASGLTWSQATRFCSGQSLSDIHVNQLSLF